MDLRETIRSQTDAALALSKHVLLSESNHSNLVFSPLSLHVVLSLVAAGSKGPTLDQMLSFLNSRSTDQLNSFSSEVVSLVFPDGSASGGPRLSMANGVWVDKSLSLKPSFKQLVETAYKDASNQVDFQTKGTVRLLFQPSEEGGAGASHMIQEGALGDAEAIFGMHIDNLMPTGSIASLPGPLLAAVCFFEAKIVGKGGHAVSPQFNLDSILATPSAILAMHQLISREADPLHSQVLFVTYVRGGNTLNVMPPYVEFGGTLRSLTIEGLYQLQKRLIEVL